MSKNKGDTYAVTDPQPYDGPIRGADGAKPYNMHLWPSEGWWASHDPQMRGFPASTRITIVELADGRWSTCGFVRNIERDRTYCDKQCCFSRRDQAIRAEAARLIRLTRLNASTNYITRGEAFKIIHWALGVVEKETGRATPAKAGIAGAMAEARATEAAQAEAARIARLPSQSDLFG